MKRTDNDVAELQLTLIRGAVPPSNLAALARAARADLADVLSEFGLTPVELKVSHTRGNAETGETVLALLDDVLNPTPALIEGMLEAMEEFDVVLGPSFDGRVYGAGIASLQSTATREILSELPTGSIASLATIVQRHGLRAFWQAPWYRGWDSATLAFAASHMRALEESEDPDFTAIRTLKELMALNVTGAGI